MIENAILGSLGVSDGDETVYRTLLQRPHATLGDLVAATAWPAARLRRHLRSLERLGLLIRSPTRPARFAPVAPDAAVEALARQRQEEIERARLGAARLAEQFRIASGDASPVGFAQEPDAIVRRLAQAGREVLILGRPPHHGAQMKPGLTYRTVYCRSSLDSPEALARARELALLGERGRVLDGVPLDLMVCDGELGLMPVDHRILVVHPSPLLDGLLALFEALWERATPLWPPRSRPVAPDGLTADDELLLALSASGLTDEAIARRMGVALRTVERRMRRVMNLLNAQTRFQAGLQAARLEILGN